MAKMTKGQPTQAPPRLDTDWRPEQNPRVAELLDHIAETLAIEYVRLMEKAAQEQDGKR